MSIAPLDKALIGLLADRRFHSGTELAGQLDISRAAVWKHLRRLEALGLELLAVPGRGYRLPSPVEWLSETSIRADLQPSAAKWLGAIEIHDELDSTNSHLLRQVGQATSGSVCLAEHQRAGRGRIGRNWVSPFGANLYLSLLWRFEDPAQVAGLSLAVGVAVLRALAAAGLPGAGLKWPNDILWGNAKLGGILLEVAGEAHGECAVVIGLGLNRHLPARVAEDIDQDWTDLDRAANGAPLTSRNTLVAYVLNELLPLLRGYSDTGLSRYLPEWRAAHAHAGQAVTLRIGDTLVEGRIVDVTDEGLLTIEDQNGARRSFASGDLQLRVSSG